MRVALVFCHGTGIYARLIRLAQRLRGLPKDVAHYNHVAIFIQGYDRGPIVIEALARGVVATPYGAWTKRAQEHLIVLLDAHPNDHQEMADFAHWCAETRQSYGWLTIATIAAHLLTGGKVSVSLDGTEICSGLAARMLERRGDTFEEPATVMPGQLLQHVRG